VTATLHVFSAVLLTLVFAVAAGSKLRSLKALWTFSDELASFRWLPSRLRRVTALAVVCAELATGLLVWVAPPSGAGLALVLLLVFTAATLQAGRAGDCQCFGEAKGAEVGGTALFVSRNLLLAATAAFLTLPGPAFPAFPSGLAAATGGLLLAVLVIRADDLVYLFAPRRRTEVIGPAANR
jgi:hypothetical protein